MTPEELQRLYTGPHATKGPEGSVCPVCKKEMPYGGFNRKGMCDDCDTQEYIAEEWERKAKREAHFKPRLDEAWAKRERAKRRRKAPPQSPAPPPVMEPVIEVDTDELAQRLWLEHDLGRLEVELERERQGKLLCFLGGVLLGGAVFYWIGKVRGRRGK